MSLTGSLPPPPPSQIAKTGLVPLHIPTPRAASPAVLFGVLLLDQQCQGFLLGLDVFLLPIQLIFDLVGLILRGLFLLSGLLQFTITLGHRLTHQLGFFFSADVQLADPGDLGIVVLQGLFLLILQSLNLLGDLLILQL